MEKSSSPAADYIEQNFESFFIPALSDFVRVPNLTPMVDKEYLTNGKLEQAIELVHSYVEKLNIERLTRTIFKTESGMPLIVYIVEPANKTETTQNVMMYGHIDKQPYGTGWLEGLSPTDPVIRGDLMYGRGSSDDGYASFACLMAVKAVQLTGVPMPRIALTLECEEESGSANLI
jgi:acetylornithine deacetylase/succinyl-diaminopimelate desuccinylase-like protein